MMNQPFSQCRQCKFCKILDDDNINCEPGFGGVWTVIQRGPREITEENKRYPKWCPRKQEFDAIDILMDVYDYYPEATYDSNGHFQCPVCGSLPTVNGNNNWHKESCIFPRIIELLNKYENEEPKKDNRDYKY